MSSWPSPRTVHLEPRVAAVLADTFELGEVRDVELAARGWVSLNVTWRFVTTSGTWAVKEVARESRRELEAAADIELAAARLDIPLPRLVRTGSGAVTALVEGRVFRCHEFVDGARPTDDLRGNDAAAAGAALARMHVAAVPFDPVLMPQVVFGESHWMQLIEQAEGVSAPWAPDLQAALPGILRAEEEASLWRGRTHRWIGSHRDVRPDNALRVADRLLMVDWDGAGPVVQGRELARALRWWAPHEDVFLNAYLEIAGDVDLDEGSGEDGALVWWLETNARHALALPGDEERDWAVSALAANFRPDG